MKDINSLVDKVVKLYQQGYSLQETLKIVKEDYKNATCKGIATETKRV